MNEKLIELPLKGKALIITDLHGNLEDYKRYMEIWKEFQDEDNHIIITGDFIHSCYKEDGSIEIINSLIKHFKDEKNFHILLGNHEWAQIIGESVYKGGQNQTHDFENLVQEKYGNQAEIKMDSYIKFFKKLSIAVKTQNNVLISHAGPSRHLESEDDVKYLSDKDYSTNLVLYEILWNRNIESTRNYLDPFLKKFNCKASVVGHTPVDGFELNGNQLILSSSFGLGKKAYLELDLKEEIKSGRDFIKMVKYLD